jgi:hypothetical protein
MKRFDPYGTHHVHRATHVNAVAGSSTLTPSQTRKPSGGNSETTVANATTNEPTKEEDKTPVSDFYRSKIPHFFD